ncbi:hypothetical protein B0T19DRAFT_184613 [Cercophora scortea]|uniref:Uncharacterized protein n=1 Tax=Cercophora scortea TaxID=314031 RepID=A0AAE0IN22_9PEZI|nr:hypothetical protein B0T19DRAFT_184613 [Cercophora scortea]
MASPRVPPQYQGPPRHPAFARYLEQAEKLKRLPCCDEQPMIGHPACTWENFKRPLLRRFPFTPADISWESRLGGGVDGCVWKVKCSDQGPFAVKVFWESEPPPATRYWAFQRECQNATILQMIAAAVEQATESSPVYIHAEPTNRRDAIENLYAFFEEGRREQRLKAVSGSLPLHSTPPLRKCFGWLQISGQFLRDLKVDGMAPPILKLNLEVRREIRPDQEYFAIVYEYLPEGENNLAAVQSQLDFLWRAGFCFGLSPREENWKDGVLVDLSEIASPGQLGWTSYYGRIEAEKHLKDKSRYNLT